MSMILADSLVIVLGIFLCHMHKEIKLTGSLPWLHILNIRSTGFYRVTMCQKQLSSKSLL